MKPINPMTAFVCAGLILCAASLPANADWQFTKLGMSFNEVVKASKVLANVSPEGGAASNDKDALTAKLAMPYTTGELTFDAIFYFDTQNRLKSVHVKLKKGHR